MVTFTRRELDLLIAGVELLKEPDAEKLAARLRILQQPGGDDLPSMRPQLAADLAEGALLLSSREE